jgi:hypothetical protein
MGVLGLSVNVLSVAMACEKIPCMLLRSTARREGVGIGMGREGQQDVT